MTERIGIIDLGSNSARLIIMNIYHNGSYNLVYHQKEGIRLGEGLHTDKFLKPAAIKRALMTLIAFERMCRLFSVTKIIAVATAAVRVAENGQNFIETIFKETNIPLRVISGEEEARLGYIGSINTLDISDAVMFDLGGASTEISLIRNRKLKNSVSLPVGAVNLTEQFSTQDSISETVLTEIYNHVLKQLETLPWLSKAGLPLIGIGGTMRNIAKMNQKIHSYPFNRVHDYRIGSLSFTELWHLLVEKNAEQRRKLPGLSSERADLIVAGTTIIKCLQEFTRSNRFIVSGCGVREGLFFDYYRTSQQLNPVIPDILTHSTYNIMNFYKVRLKHAEHVTNLATTMFDGWQKLHGLGERERKILMVASLLHDSGITISYYDHARHSSYIIENARLFGLSHREQMLCAVIASWHHGYSAKMGRNRLYNEFLDDNDWSVARKLALLLSLAENLDVTEEQSVTRVSATLTDKKAQLKLYVKEETGLLSKIPDKQNKWFKREYGIDLNITKS